jgi:NAD(P)H-flavin reductase
MATATPELAPAVGPMVPAPFLVRGRDRDTADTWTLTLEPGSGETPVVGPGQFMMVYAFGIGEVPVSVSDSRDGEDGLVLTVRAVGAVTEAICASKPGAVLGLRGPYGTSWPIGDATGADVVVIAGGIGLAPLRPVVLRALARRQRYGQVALLYGCRTPGDLLYPAQLEAWRRDATVSITVDAPAESWSGKVGVVSQLIPNASFDPMSSVAFVCGPEIMMRFTIEALLARGVPPDRIHVSLERNMRCGLGHCGHCQLGPTLICRDGPVYPYATVAPWLEVREL